MDGKTKKRTNKHTNKLKTIFGLLHLPKYQGFFFVQCQDLKNGWQIISAKKSFAVYAATRTEKAEWMAHINKCIQDLLAKSKMSLQTINTILQ